MREEGIQGVKRDGDENCKDEGDYVRGGNRWGEAGGEKQEKLKRRNSCGRGERR